MKIDLFFNHVNNCVYLEHGKYNKIIKVYDLKKGVTKKIIEYMENNKMTSFKGFKGYLYKLEYDNLNNCLNDKEKAVYLEKILRSYFDFGSIKRNNTNFQENLLIHYLNELGALHNKNGNNLFKEC